MPIINNSIITDATHISALLYRLKKKQCTLEIKTLAESGDFIDLGISELLNINTEENTLLFDVINKKIALGQQIKVFTKHNGIEMYFQTTVTGFNKNNHPAYFITSTPTSINHKQRRQQYRVELQNLWKIPVTLIDESIKKPLSAYIYNISTGGINVRSSTSPFNKIKPDAVIDTVIQLPNEPSVRCKLLVRQTNVNSTAGFQQLAGQFLNLDARQEKTIQSFVNNVDRKNIKKRAELQVS